MQKKILTVSFALLSLSSSVAQAFQYENHVPEEQSRQLETDLLNFEKMDFSNADSPRRRELFGITAAPNATSLRAWLDERAKIIVPQEWDPNKNVVATRPGVYKGAPKKIASNTPQHPQEEPQSSAVVVMANYGAAIYSIGRYNGVVYTLGLNGLPPFELTSPRVGLLQIGEGLFNPYFAINSQDSESVANSINRLSILFHEARHSDGHGKSLTFSHAICPKGHGYEGLPACDTNLNGPYTLGAEVNKMMLKNCSTCTSAEKEMLRLRALDSMSRILMTYDDLPSAGEVETLKITSGNCLFLAKMMPNLSNECEKNLLAMYRIIKEGLIQRLAIDMDPTPEKAVK